MKHDDDGIEIKDLHRDLARAITDWGYMDETLCREVKESLLRTAGGRAVFAEQDAAALKEIDELIKYTEYQLKESEIALARYKEMRNYMSSMAPGDTQ